MPGADRVSCSELDFETLDKLATKLMEDVRKGPDALYGVCEYIALLEHNQDNLESKIVELEDRLSKQESKSDYREEPRIG